MYESFGCHVRYFKTATNFAIETFLKVFHGGLATAKINNNSVIRDLSEIIRRCFSSLS